MYKVIKKLEFCYGHRLLKHGGPCRHLHGHNALVELELTSDQLNDQGMVRDFWEIKQAMQAWIDQTFDHKMLLEAGDPLIETLKKAAEPVVVLPFPITAENLAKLIFDYAKQSDFPVTEVRIWETQDSMASYRET